MAQLLSITDIKALYPNEWVLLGNPIMDESKIDVISGIPLFHSKDKKEVFCIGRDKTSNFDLPRYFQTNKKDYRYFQSHY
jgi:hypothetical protein